jgi:CDP-diacylglycerol---glycerol-3-phosphate 3-phosphatidyltransferase
MVGGYIGAACQKVLNGLVRTLAHLNPNPNLLSLIGLGINVWAAIHYAFGQFWQAGVVMILANLFDMLDGRIARLTGRVTKFGAFLDSSLDRLSDMGVFLGIMYYYTRLGTPTSALYVLLTGAALIGSVMVSYTSARAESLIPKCDVGFLRRPERVVLLILGSLLHKMEPTVWLMAVLSFWTFCHRLYHTWVALRKMDEPPSIAQPQPVNLAEKPEKGEGQRLQLGPDLI